jgi:transposase-like protein
MIVSQAHVVSYPGAYAAFQIILEGSVMAMNRIQFQRGLSMPEFFSRYGSESQCAAALEKARWPSGFRCRRCGAVAHCVLRGGSHQVFQCNACRHQTSLIAGTVFQGTKLGLSVWFLAIYLISQAKTGLSALALKRQLGVSYPSAWLMHHKLMQAMAEREVIWSPKNGRHEAW